MSNRSDVKKRFGKLALACLAMGVSALLAGCGPNKVSKQPLVDESKAKEILIVVLDGWKEGKKPEDFGTQSPAVIVQDIEWLRGAKLSEYTITGKHTPKDANLISQVQLKMVSPEGKEVSKTVNYIVGTSPKLSVFREIMTDN